MLVVQVTKSHGDLDSVELGALLSESLRLTQVHKELSSSDESHDEEDLLLSHEDIGHTH